jgi:hypothetical protein
MHQAPDLLPEAGIDDILGDRHVGLVKLRVITPYANGAGAVHHRLDILTQRLRRRRWRMG